MATTPRPRFPALPPGLVRRSDEHVVAGVCAGVARWLGVDPIVVRLAALILALANGVGVVAYLVAWVVLPEAPPESTAASPASRPRDRDRSGRRNAELALAVGCITLGLLVLVRWSAPFFPDFVVWPGTLAAIGIGLVLARGGDGGVDAATGRAPAPSAGRGDLRRDARPRLTANPLEALRGGRWFWLRMLGGALLLVLGIAMFLATNAAFGAVGKVGIAVLATALGVVLVFGPWIVRLVGQLGDERRERIRSEERADMAAHLHDSVLQTLALIQRNTDASSEARSLARRQERELRAWLYDDRHRADGGAAGTPARSRSPSTGSPTRSKPTTRPSRSPWCSWATARSTRASRRWSRPCERPW